MLKFEVKHHRHQLRIVTSSRAILMPTSLYIRRLHLPSRIRQLALDQPFKVALRDEFNNELTYQRFYEAVKSVAKGLEHGKAGKSVAILAKDPIQMTVGIFGTWLSNRIAIPLRNLY